MEQMLKPYLHWNLSLVALLTAILTTAIYSRKELDVKLLDIASYIFAVSGTFTALVLPAAELAGSFIVKRLEYWVGELSKASNQGTQGDAENKKKEQQDIAKEAIRFFDEVKRHAIPAWRGSLYVFTAFLISSFALVVPYKFQICQYIISSGSLLIGTALGFLLVGSFLFLPFAFYVYRLELLQGTYDMFTRIAAIHPPASADETSPPAPSTPSPPSASGGGR